MAAFQMQSKEGLEGEGPGAPPPIKSFETSNESIHVGYFGVAGCDRLDSTSTHPKNVAAQDARHHTKTLHDIIRRYPNHRMFQYLLDTTQPTHVTNRMFQQHMLDIAQHNMKAHNVSVQYVRHHSKALLSLQLFCFGLPVKGSTGVVRHLCESSVFIYILRYEA